MKRNAAQPIVIYGAAGFAREVLQLLLSEAADSFRCEGFLVDREYRDTDIVDGLPVLGDADWLLDKPTVAAVIAIGECAPRMRIAGRLTGTHFATLIHPRAWVGKTVSIGEGSIICAGAAVTADIVLGRHVQVHVNSTVGHNTRIGDFVTIAPGANVSGRCVIGEGTFVGAGAVILPDITVGSNATVGAGAVVTKAVPANSVVVGVPARLLRRQ